MAGCIHIYEGDGKGKTTAGVGLAVRCAGSGKKVLYTQFLKTNTSSELHILEQIDQIDLERCDRSFGFVRTMSEETKKEAKAYYREHFQKVISKAKRGDYGMLVLDEIIASYNNEMIEQSELLEFLKNHPEELEIVMTGRNPAEELVELADYVSRIQKIKHPFDKGIPARLGIEM